VSSTAGVRNVFGNNVHAVLLPAFNSFKSASARVKLVWFNKLY
jgi:hypothetical protein